MPTLVQIGNVKIQLYADDHHPPHFHVVTREFAVQVRIDTLEVLRGKISKRDLEIALAWARDHKKEINDEWDRLNGR